MINGTTQVKDATFLNVLMYSTPNNLIKITKHTHVANNEEMVQLCRAKLTHSANEDGSCQNFAEMVSGNRPTS